jgi:hypothetical protein
VGIVNIHILKEPEINSSARKAQEMIEAKRIAEHHRGEHPFGRKRRDCPLCLNTP